MRTAPNLSKGGDPLFDSRGRRHGTPQTTQLGQMKACYTLLSSISGNPTAMLLDRYLMPLVPAQGMNSYMSSKNMYDPSNVMTGWTNVMGSTTSAPSTNNLSAGYTYANFLKNIGECGNSAFDIFSNGNYASPTNVGTNKHLPSFQFIDSDHTDKSIIYIYDETADQIVAIDRISHLPRLGMSPLANVKAHKVSIGTIGQGGMTYNLKRKELIAFTASSAGVFSFKIWSNVDFDKYPSPNIALNRPEVTCISSSMVCPTNIATGTGAYNLKPVLDDTGVLWVLVQTTQTASHLYSIAFDRVAQSGTATLRATLSTPNNIMVGGNTDAVKKMQSRNGSTVMLFMQYYYYGSGAVFAIIDKKLGTYITATFADTGSYSTSIVPFGDSGWLAAMFNSSTNGNPSNANNNLRCWERFSDTGALVEVATARRPQLPWLFSNNSNTDYPILNQVADYALLTDQSLD